MIDLDFKSRNVTVLINSKLYNIQKKAKGKYLTHNQSLPKV